MGKINGCLKCVFIFFNVLFAILGGFLIYGFVSISGSQQEQLSSADVPGLVWGWLLAIGILCVSSLGIFAACSEKPIALKLFATFMGVGMIIMLYMGINVANSRPQMMSEVKKYSGEIVQFLMKQNGMTLEELQEFLKCCGKSSAHEWGNQIPDSCGCKPSSPGYGGYGGFINAECTSRPQGTRGPDQIYTMSCSEVLLWLIDFGFSITLGFLFGFAVIALLGLIITLIMIYQVKYNDDAGSIYMKGY
ncbi:tetraspanin-8-like [Archocentrus centrarchus]|uniref:tetraspanin-8-like n=1 Tax=Archocentrus centrarchus TaxID=63155 RepID=UPI0011E9F57D|nr:tetraspanin-8-like [Archocentrus centrarchus]